jgi:hypothetical protein
MHGVHEFMICFNLLRWNDWSQLDQDSRHCNTPTAHHLPFDYEALCLLISSENLLYVRRNLLESNHLYGHNVHQ